MKEIATLDRQIATEIKELEAAKVRAGQAAQMLALNPTDASLKAHVVNAKAEVAELTDSIEALTAAREAAEAFASTDAAKALAARRKKADANVRTLLELQASYAAKADEAFDQLESAIRALTAHRHEIHKAGMDAVNTAALPFDDSQRYVHRMFGMVSEFGYSIVNRLHRVIELTDVEPGGLCSFNRLALDHRKRTSIEDSLHRSNRNINSVLTDLRNING